MANNLIDHAYVMKAPKKSQVGEYVEAGRGVCLERAQKLHALSLYFVLCILSIWLLLYNVSFIIDP